MKTRPPAPSFPASNPCPSSPPEHLAGSSCRCQDGGGGASPPPPFSVSVPTSIASPPIRCCSRPWSSDIQICTRRLRGACDSLVGKLVGRPPPSNRRGDHVQWTSPLCCPQRGGSRQPHPSTPSWLSSLHAAASIASPRRREHPTAPPLPHGASLAGPVAWALGGGRGHVPSPLDLGGSPLIATMAVALCPSTPLGPASAKADPRVGGVGTGLIGGDPWGSWQNLCLTQTKVGDSCVLKHHIFRWRCH